MSGENGKTNGGRDASLRNLVKWKPGQSGNPKGRKRKLHFADYLRQHFDEKVQVTLADGTQGTRTKEEILARQIAVTAMGGKGISAVAQAFCLKVVADQLWPVPKEHVPFVIAKPEFHDDRTMNVVGLLEQRADGGPIEPDMVMELLEADARGELDAELGPMFVEGNDNGNDER